MRSSRARGVILTGGGNISESLGTIDQKPAKVPECDTGLAPERDQLETMILHASLVEDWPVIGVCRGMQVLNIFHGGTIVKVRGHAGTTHNMYTDKLNNKQNKYEFDEKVNSFHDYGIREKDLGKNLRILAGLDGFVEAIIHERFRHLGIMWHPERNKSYSHNDMNIFRTFFFN